MRENRKNQTKNRRNGKKNCAIFRLYQMIQLTNLRARRLQDIRKTQMEKEKGYETLHHYYTNESRCDIKIMNRG